MTPYKPRSRRQIQKIVAAKIALAKHQAEIEAEWRKRRSDEHDQLRALLDR